MKGKKIGKGQQSTVNSKWCAEGMVKVFNSNVTKRRQKEAGGQESSSEQRQYKREAILLSR